jgi:hypothetical protein
VRFSQKLLSFSENGECLVREEDVDVGLMALHKGVKDWRLSPTTLVPPSTEPDLQFEPLDLGTYISGSVAPWQDGWLFSGWNFLRLSCKGAAFKGFSHVATTGAVATFHGLGLMFTTGYVLRMWTTPDMIAMSAMSDFRVEWMAAVARGGKARALAKARALPNVKPQPKPVVSKRRKRGRVV